MAGNNQSGVLMDSSYVLAYLLPDENIPRIQKFFNQLKIREVALIAPPLLPFEVLNGLNMAVVRKRIAPKPAQELGKKFLSISFELQPVDLLATFALAIKYKLTVYDAAYLYLARKNLLSLLTLDQNLKKFV